MRQIAPLLREIDAIADDEFVGDVEPDPVDLDLDLAARGLVQQRADTQRFRLARLQDVMHLRQCVVARALAGWKSSQRVTNAPP